VGSVEGSGGHRQLWRPSWWGGLLSEFLRRLDVDASTGQCMYQLVGSFPNYLSS